MTIRLKDVEAKLLALIFAFSPFFQHYVLPGIGKNLEYLLILLVGGGYAVLSILKRNVLTAKNVATPALVIMAVYCIINHVIERNYIYKPEITNIVNIISFFAVLFICLFDFRNISVRQYYYRYVENIAVAMSIIVFAQIVIYYVFGNAITFDRSFLFPFKDCFSDSGKQYLLTSRMVINGLFRPSAFFLEPAHFSQFCTIGLACSLIREDILLNKRAIIISAGIVLTTSGLGILSVAFIWAVFLYINSEGISRKRMNRMIIGTLFFVFVVCILFFVSESFRSAVMRIVVSSNGYDSGIQGRTRNIVLINRLSLQELIFGMGYKNIPTYGNLNTQYYLTGIFELIYCQGIIGTSLFVICYIYMMFKACKAKQNLPLHILFAYIPFLLGSSNLVMLTLIQYIPFLYIPLKKTNNTRLLAKRI